MEAKKTLLTYTGLKKLADHSRHGKTFRCGYDLSGSRAFADVQALRYGGLCHGGQSGKGWICSHCQRVR